MRKKTTICRFEPLSRNQDALNLASKGPRRAYQGSSNTDVATKRKKRATVKREAKTVIGDKSLILDLGIQTRSEANSFEPWKAKYARHQEQKRIVALALAPFRGSIPLPCRVFLTRFAPDSLDVFDNLPMSFKFIVDTICSIITGDYRPGRADGDRRISIACDQVKSKEYGIRIEISW